MVGLASKWVRLAPIGINPGLFQIRFQCIWRPRWSKKVPDMSHLGQAEPLWGQNRLPWCRKPREFNHFYKKIPLVSHLPDLRGPRDLRVVVHCGPLLSPPGFTSSFPRDTLGSGRLKISKSGLGSKRQTSPWPRRLRSPQLHREQRWPGLGIHTDHHHNLTSDLAFNFLNMSPVWIIANFNFN